MPTNMPTPSIMPKPIPQPQNPKPPLPVPVQLNIRFITDNTTPPQPRPASPTRGRESINPPKSSNLPPSTILGLKEEAGPSQSRKSDQFYGAWDRFILQKGRAMKRSNRDRKSRNETDQAEHTSKWASRSSSMSGPSIEDKGPSLDTDIEGRPGHIVSMNDEGVQSRQNALTSYEEAKASCIAKVEAIVRECKRLNQKYYDRMFNLASYDSLVSLGAEDEPSSVREFGVGAVKRIEDIFEDPTFFEDEPTANDIRQGNIGDCWFLAALTALSGNPELIKRVCVARDEEVGVYGFVFYRDGEWISETVDDRLALRYPDDIQRHPTDFLVITRGDKNAMSIPLGDSNKYSIQKLPKEFKEDLRRGSKALYFGNCRDSNETWLPLIEKAYAKAHGDYQSIDGGATGEAIEDLTGGVASCIRSENVLYKDKLWSELRQVNDKFLFGAYTRLGRDSDSADEDGFVRAHAYCVLGAFEIDPPKRNIKKKKGEKKDQEKPNYISKDGKIRLLKLHNPWGNQEWNGAWSDGSKEWNADILRELDHTFDDDGTFFIAFPDFLKFFPIIDRIRLIGPEWTITQQWTSVNVPLAVEYLDTSFKITINKPGPVVFVLSQPDTRYFRGLTGRYLYSLHFRLYKDGEKTYLIRSMEHSGQMRSCNAEVEDLEPGTYEMLVKITAYRCEELKTAEEVIRDYKEDRRKKLLAVGKSFDLAHSKGHLRELEKANRQTNMLDELEFIRGKLSKVREQRKRARDREKLRRKRAQTAVSQKREAMEAKQKEKREARRKENLAKRNAERSDLNGDSTKNKDKTNYRFPVSEIIEIIEEPTMQKESQDPETQQSDTEGNALPPSSSTTFQTAVSELEEATESEDGNIFLPEPKHESKHINPSMPNEEIISVRGPRTPFPPGLRRVPLPPHAPNPMARDAQHDWINRSPNSPPRGPPPIHRPRYHREFSSDSTPSSPPMSPASSVCDDDFPWDNTMDGPVTPDLCSDSDLSPDDMYVKDPWQATCVIGLRVCSLDENAKIEVCKGVTKARRKRGDVAMGRARSPA